MAQVASQRSAYDRLAVKRTTDKVIFVEMLKRERLNFENKLLETDKKVLWFESEMRKVYVWAQDRQTEYQKGIAVLQSTTTDSRSMAVEHANTNNCDRASELESLRREAFELIR